MKARRPAVSAAVAQGDALAGLRLWLPALAVLLSLIAYGPALGGTLLWDDAGHVTAPGLRSLGGLFRIWFEPGATQQYYPVLHSAFWLEHLLWGDATLGYHLINVVLHATAACVFASVLRQLAVPGATAAALLFALHPVAVESVAWISEQKNTLSTLLYLCAARAWLTHLAQPSRGRYALATAFFVAALLAKSVTATLPAALLVIAWWQHGRLDWRRDVMPLLPWFAGGVAFGLVTLWIERTQIGAQGTDFALSPLERVLLCGRVVWFYFGKLLWPANLTFIYPRWQINGGVPWQYLFPAALLAVVFVLWRVARGGQRGPLTVLLLYAGTLFPVLGFVNVYPFLFSYVADHFQYLASLAIFAAGGAALSRLPAVRARVVGALAFIACGLLTWSQSRMYENPLALYETTLARNPTCWMAHNNLALELGERGRTEEAIAHIQRALQLRPDYPEALINLGRNLTMAGRADEALRHLDRALQLQPRSAEAHNNRGQALMALGRIGDGFTAFSEALRLRPEYPLARYNIGLALARNGEPAKALPEFEAAARLDPMFAPAAMARGLALVSLGRPAEAMPHLARAAELNPTSPDIQASFARALLAAGRPDEAVARFQVALRLTPNSGQLHAVVAQLLRDLGRTQEAVEHYNEAVRLGVRPQ